MNSSGFRSHPSSFPLLPYGRQSIAADDIAAVVEALRSDYLTTGPRVDAFEKALAEYCGARYPIAVANGTAALHLAALAAGLKPGQRLLAGVKASST
jgi:perosamine synthetase